MNDDELRARLRAADPARHLTHSADLEIPERAMTINPTSNPGRGRYVAVAAAAAVVLLALGGLLLNRGDDDPAPTAGNTPDDTSSTTDIFAGTGAFTIDAGAEPARCAPPDAPGLAALDAAFAGTVVSLDAEQIVLEPQTVFKGQPVDRAVLKVNRGAPSEALPVDFRVGGEYVVGVKAGKVQLCGYTDEKSSFIVDTYTRAFPDPVTR